MSVIKGVLYPGIDAALYGCLTEDVNTHAERFLRGAQCAMVYLIGMVNTKESLWRNCVGYMFSLVSMSIGDWRCAFFGHHLAYHTVEENICLCCVSCGEVVQMEVEED